MAELDDRARGARATGAAAGTRSASSKSRSKSPPSSGASTSSAGSSGGEVEDALRQYLDKAGKRVIDLFREWDVDHSGGIDRDEFQVVAAKLANEVGYDFSKRDVNRFFDQLTAQHSDGQQPGVIEYSDLDRVIRHGLGSRDVAIPAADRAGAVGEIELGAHNHIGIRRASKDGVRKEGAAKLTGNSGTKLARRASLMHQLSDVMRKGHFRARDLFRDWASENSSQLTKAEFGCAMEAMGFQVT
jgi:hypothetical protein